MKFSHYILAFLIGASSTNISFGQMTLLEAKEYALKHHFDILNADLEYNKAIHKKREYLSAGMPEAYITGGFNQFPNLPVQVIDASFFNPSAGEGEVIAFRAGTEFNSSASLNVNQLLFDGSYFVGLEASKLLVELQSIQKNRSREEVLFGVIEAYHIASVATENDLFADSVLQLTLRVEEKQKGFLELGLMTQEEFDQIHYAVLRTKNNKENAELQLQNAMALLKYSMNCPLDSTFLLATSIGELSLNALSPSLGTVNDNSTLKLLENQIKLSACDVKNNKAGFLPSLSAYFQQGYNAYRTSFDFFDDKPWYSQTSWGIQMTIPVFSSGKGKSTLKQAQIKFMQDENTLKTTQNGLKLQEIQFSNELKSSIKQKELQQQNIVLTEKIYKNAILKQKAGKISNTEVTQKLNQLIMTQAEYTATLINVFKSKIKLDKLYNKLNTK
ncbi:TolC family protein [Crocinitomicaceae bacterium]|nr:TolC family protein [Crocinitomicaceae bacterium]